MPDQPPPPSDAPRTAPQPDLKPQEARPSDAEIAHAPYEGDAVRDPRREAREVRDAHADRTRGSLDGRPGKDLAAEAQTGERVAGRGGRLGA
jgi:hypothetical protein